MTLNQLQYFQTIARTENYHLAAEELYISQPSLSRAIAALEKELGILLFEKNGRGISLTKSGGLFLEYVDRILDECHIAVYKMKQLSGAGGRIDIGYVFPLANSYMPRMARAFLSLEENRNVTFSFHQDQTSSILNGIKKGQLDVGFCSFVDYEPDLEFFPILSQEIIMIVPVDHALAAYEEASIMELCSYPVIGYNRFSGLGSYTQDLYRRLKIHPDIVCECPDENAIMALVAEHFGIAITAKVDSLDPSRIYTLKISDMSLSHQVFMAWLKNHYQIPAITRFIEFMKKQSNFGK